MLGWLLRVRWVAEGAWASGKAAAAVWGHMRWGLTSPSHAGPAHSTPMQPASAAPAHLPAPAVFAAAVPSAGTDTQGWVVRTRVPEGCACSNLTQRGRCAEAARMGGKGAGRRGACDFTLARAGTTSARSRVAPNCRRRPAGCLTGCRLLAHITLRRVGAFMEVPFEVHGRAFFGAPAAPACIHPCSDHVVASGQAEAGRRAAARSGPHRQGGVHRCGRQQGAHRQVGWSHSLCMPR